MKATDAIPPSETDVSRTLQAFESRHDILAVTFDGWCAWPLVRFPVARALLRLPHDSAPVRSFSRSEWFLTALGDLRRLLTRRRAGYLAHSYCENHLELEKGLVKDIFLDELVRELGACKMESILWRAAFVNAERQLMPRDFTTVGPNLIARALAHSVPSEAWSVARRLSELIRGDLRVEWYSAELVARRLAEFRARRRVYEAVMRHLGTECLLLAAPDAGLTAAARALGASVVEFQHGHTHRDAPAYSWSEYAVPYKARMPIPQRQFVYGEHYRRELGAHGFWSEELRVVGSLRVDAHRLRPSGRSSSRGTIVLTTQGLDTERLIAFVGEYLRLSRDIDCRLQIVPHPVYDQSSGRYREAFAAFPQVEVMPVAGSATTLDLLRAANLHVSIYSTCHYEALALGVPTVILPLRGAENVRHLYQQGHAMLADTPAALARIAARWRELRVPAEVGNDYFAPGALHNILHELRELRSEGRGAPAAAVHLPEAERA